MNKTLCMMAAVVAVALGGCRSAPPGKENAMIRINCTLVAKDGRREEALEAAKALTAVSLTQDGCIAYDVFESATRPSVLMIFETWRDKPALDAHTASEPFKRHFGVMKEASELIKGERFNF